MSFELIRGAMARSHTAPSRPTHIDPELARLAAVAMVFRPAADGGAELLMIKRSEQPGDPWSGHMAFPGGAAEPEDADALDTARRETREEVALELAGVPALGSLDPIYSPRAAIGRPRQVIVRPFVFALDAAPPPLHPNVEVASTHWFHLDRLLTDEGRGTFPWSWRDREWEMPRVDLDGCRIWGMSLRMIDDLVWRIRATRDAR